MFSKFAIVFLLQITAPIEKLKSLLDSIQNLPEIKHGTVVASVRDKAGAYCLQYNAEKAVNSASTLKLFSTATALSVLGKNYRYQTFLEYDGNIQDSVLNGNIYLRGTGDPSLGSERFERNYTDFLLDASTQIKQMGIKQVNGFVIGDGSIFPENSLADTWAWYDVGNAYGAGCTGLNFNENKYKATFEPSKTLMGSAKLLRTEPEIPYINFINRVLTDVKNSDDQTQIYSTPFNETILLEGKVPMGVAEFSTNGAVPDAAYLAGFMLQKSLENIGIKISQANIAFRKVKELGGYFPRERKIIKSWSSPTIVEMAKQTNYESLNLYADSFLKTVGYQESKDASFDSSIKILKQIWQNKGVDLAGFMIKDGSGLSEAGFLTANNLTDMLWTMQKDTVFQDFYSTIPVVGVSGTVKNLCKGTKAAGNIYAKSGSISGTRAYSGYFTAKNGELMCFTFIINRYTDGAGSKVRRYLEKMMTLLVEI